MKNSSTTRSESAATYGRIQERQECLKLWNCAFAFFSFGKFVIQAPERIPPFFRTWQIMQQWWQTAVSSPLHVPEAGIPSKRFCWEVLEKAFTQSVAILNIWFDAPQESFSLPINLEENSLKVTAGKHEGNRFRSLHPGGDTLWD